jgi:hypothetical protein
VASNMSTVRLQAIHFVNRVLIHVLLLALSILALWAQTERDPSRSASFYQNAELGFRYTTPSEMRDKTERSRADMKEETEVLHASADVELLLSMSSGPDDMTAIWRSVTILAYPREAFGNLDDASAETKMNGWVGGPSGGSASASRKVLVSGQNFAVSVFGMQKGAVRKGAVVWTTIRKGKLLSFAFVANSPEQLTKLAESMKSVQFF